MTGKQKLEGDRERLQIEAEGFGLALDYVLSYIGQERASLPPKGLRFVKHHAVDEALTRLSKRICDLRSVLPLATPDAAGTGTRSEEAPAP